MREPAREAHPVDLETDRAWQPVDRAAVLAVFFGGALGGLARYAAQSAIPLDLRDFDWPTLTINCTGAFALGMLLVHLRPRPQARIMRLLLGTGFLGGWTTLSAVVVTADQQVAQGHALLALAYVAASAGGGLLSVLCGFVLASRRC